MTRWIVPAFLAATPDSLDRARLAPVVGGAASYVVLLEGPRVPVAERVSMSERVSIAKRASMEALALRCRDGGAGGA